MQDEYLQEKRKSKGIVTLKDISAIKEAFISKYSYAEKISLWQGNITRLTSAFYSLSIKKAGAETESDMLHSEKSGLVFPKNIKT